MRTKQRGVFYFDKICVTVMTMTCLPAGTAKYQIIENGKNKEIFGIYNDFSSVHDFRMFKESSVGILPRNIFILIGVALQ